MLLYGLFQCLHSSCEYPDGFALSRLFIIKDILRVKFRMNVAISLSYTGLFSVTSI